VFINGYNDDNSLGGRLVDRTFRHYSIVWKNYRVLIKNEMWDKVAAFLSIN